MKLEELVFVLTLIYVWLANALSTGAGGVTGALALFLLIPPVPGAVAFLYGARSGDSRGSFIAGFIPALVFFIAGGAFGAFEGFPVFSGIFLGACSGAIGYSGAVRSRGEKDWVVFALIGALLWVIVMAGSML